MNLPPPSLPWPGTIAGATSAGSTVKVSSTTPMSAPAPGSIPGMPAVPPPAVVPPPYWQHTPLSPLPPESLFMSGMASPSHAAAAAARLPQAVAAQPSTMGYVWPQQPLPPAPVSMAPTSSPSTVRAPVNISPPVTSPSSSSASSSITIAAAMANSVTFNFADVEVQWSQPQHYRLGKGGMGEVWAGKWQKHMDVAVKILHSDAIGASDEQKSLFLREVAILRSIRHPNIVQFIGAAEVNSRWYLVTELCRYKSLQELLAAPSMRAHLTWTNRKRMMKEAALGLHHLHHQKIVHMDIKPLNFFVTEHFAVKVGDFGLAKQLEHSQMGASVKGFTVTHTAPETLQGICSFPADVYSFALVLFELMTLQPPWTKEDIGPMPRMLPNRVAGGLRPTCPVGMPADHRALLESAWVGEPSKRATMNDICAAIDRLSDIPEPVSPSSPLSPRASSDDDVRLIASLRAQITSYERERHDRNDREAKLHSDVARLTYELQQCVTQLRHTEHRLRDAEQLALSNATGKSALETQVAKLEKQLRDMTTVNESKKRDDEERLREREKMLRAIEAEMAEATEAERKHAEMQEQQAKQKAAMARAMSKTLVHPDTEVFDTPGWNEPTSHGKTGWKDTVTATVYSFWRSGRGYHRHQLADRRVRVKRAPFAQGYFRVAYYFQDVTDVKKPLNMIAKQKTELHENNESFHMRDVAAQLWGKYLADTFMQVAKPTKNVDFLVPCIYQLHDPDLLEEEQWFFCDPRLETSVDGVTTDGFERYTNNDNYISTRYPRTLLAFSHWTWSWSGERFMMVDLQGVAGMLCDPQIHSHEPERNQFGEGDCGKHGFKRFFEKHVCNDICRAAKLSVHPTIRGPAGDEKKGSTIMSTTYSNQWGLCATCGTNFPKLTAAQLKTRHEGQPVVCRHCVGTIETRVCSQCRGTWLHAKNPLLPVPTRCQREACADTTIPVVPQLKFADWRK